MNEHQLSKRLAEVASLVPAGSRLADIGTDHAYLPVHLLIQGKICTAVAGEINEGPYQSAVNQVEKLGLKGVVDVRKGNGLEVIRDGEVDVIAIAGMGGALICQILEEGIEKLSKVKRLILQPNMAEHLIRQWLIDHHWELKEEKVIEEDHKIYEILMAEPGDPEKPYLGLDEMERKKAILLGPFLLQEKSKVFKKKWSAEIEKKKKILLSLQNAEDKGVREQEIQSEIKLLEEGIQE
ncbi:tRNA (adenine(22)-N(1))-methyltransferase [Caldalkalibacillus mannanilyticus]|uniref:tRNA (adenine(22)-N(1))-methyltransferase n=1 Tax=Caldalkalibacillus mannanilyticus TaxID=1418 RepID=UPI00046A1490|nr:tRNA (adenine(22)-N(1))-methyltransferase TrmK [Caldalkalibacillus mannanilyticus]